MENQKAMQDSELEAVVGGTGTGTTQANPGLVGANVQLTDFGYFDSSTGDNGPYTFAIKNNWQNLYIARVITEVNRPYPYLIAQKNGANVGWTNEKGFRVIG